MIGPKYFVVASLTAVNRIVAPLSAAVVAIGLLAHAPEARAQSAQCGALVAELNGLNAKAGGGGGGNAAKFRSRVDGLEKRSRANGCGGSSKFGQPQQCAGILAQLSNARSQLAAAEASSGGGGLTKAQQSRRSKLQAQVAKLRCGQAPAAPAQQQAAPKGSVPVASAPTQSDRGQQQQYIVHGSGRLVAVQPSAQGIGQGGLLSLLFGGGSRRQQQAPSQGLPTTLTTLAPEHKITGIPDSGDGGPSYSRVSFGGGAYRTLCVRKCDGYYFPISTVTYRGNFLRDEMVCKALCPGTDVGLYAHPSGSESEAMHAISDGLSYAALPTAYQYRRSFDPKCTCAFEAKMITVAGGEQVIDVAAYSPAVTSDAAAAIEAATTPLPGGEAVVTDVAATSGAAPVEPSAAASSETSGATPPGAPGLSVSEDGSVVGAAAADAVVTPVAATETPATAAATAALIEPAGAAPQGQAIPIDTKPPIRFRTIGPTFLPAQ